MSMLHHHSAMQELRSIFADGPVGGNFCHPISRATLWIGQWCKVLISQTMSKPLPDLQHLSGKCKWPGNLEMAASTTVGHAPIRDTHAKTRKGLLRSICDYSRTTTPTEHGQTAFSRANIQAAKSTSRPARHASRNTFQLSRPTSIRT